MMKIVLVNLSDYLYKNSRIKLNKSAKLNGVNIVYSYDFSDLIHTPFYSENKEILTQNKGLGYWLWKPFIILNTFDKLNEGDIVFYSDCGISIVDTLLPLVDICTKSDIILFNNGNFTNKQWTKRDCFRLMNCDTKEYWDGVHIDASFQVYRVSENSRNFLNEWLFYGRNKNIITDLPNISGENNLTEFIEHRWDQSILSILSIKYNLEIYRCPSQYGNHYKKPDIRVENEFNCINQLYQEQVTHYSDLYFNNSDYGQLLNHHRVKQKESIFKKIVNNVWSV